MLYAAWLIFPLISTTSNGKVLEPETLHGEMAVRPQGENKQRNQVDNTNLCFRDQDQAVNKNDR